ncbi:M56 family metallopeptidase [Nocardioides sp. zg-1228]|uniref:M56 family metallopeptidase n=1 Tax=Nocardioides sp. zg-1228 TaxID=2763008 RepID=UPI001642E38E|nr:M56 family metallopeptidase [Nocardioides sp. zg-1228]MBC2934333.1 M56 family metallopeptidase [Nocardioides sp. zg-1228]QSF59111.1 M56 family metallopeptidase [Nocardioides sp. zg-1228]
MPTPLVLGVLAVLLAGPLPWALSRWTRLRRTPAAAMLLWQSTALAAVLAALGVGLSLVTACLWGPGASRSDVAVAALALGMTLVVLARLLLSGHRTGTSLRRIRREHRDRVDLVARRDGELSVLEHPLPVAYCVPGMSGSRIVVSHSTLTRLAPAELAAVLEHERSHLRSRHDLALEAFTVLHRAFPRWVASAAARDEVEVLVEVLADRAACQDGHRRALLSALLTLAGTPAPAGALGSGGSIAARVEVLRDPRPRRVQAAAVSLLAVLILAAPTLQVVLPWLSGLDAT